MKNFILILCLATFSQWVYAQNKQISGRVVDTKGEAAIGASILEKGTDWTEPDIMPESSTSLIM